MMGRMDLLPLGCVDEDVLMSLENCIQQSFGLGTKRLTPHPN